MYKIIDGKSTGKTKKLMELAKSNNGVIACSNPIAMEEKAKNYGIFGINFITYYDLIKTPEKYREYDAIFIDELENFSQHVVSAAGVIKGYTLSIED